MKGDRVGVMDGRKSKLSKSEKKSARKQAKARHTLLKHDGLQTTSTPSPNLLISNGGLGNGIHRDEIHGLFSCVGPVEDVVMLREKPYCFVRYGDPAHAISAMQAYHGYHLREGQGPFSVTLYLSFIEKVPLDKESPHSLPPGLVLLPDFIDSDLEERLINSIEWDRQIETEKNSLKHRRVKHHGYEFNYTTNNVDKDQPLPEGMPALYRQVIDRIMATEHVQFRPDQLTINQYQPGQGIPPHVDTHSAFEDAIVSLSLGSQVVMEFSHPDGRRVPVVLPNRSLLIMTGEARYLWSHGITPKKTDVIPDPTSADNLTLHHRGQRTSFTFRSIRRSPCTCNYPSQCDSQRQPAKEPGLPPEVQQPRTEEEAARLEEEQVHAVYDNIAEHFSGTRYKPWPKVVEFLNDLEPGSVVLDVGCGNGKYMAVNKTLYMIGCDRSNQLIGICRQRGLEGFVCDSLALPVGDGTMDACISIAVIHHMSTESRRMQALKEISRILKSGGQALVTVWAMEQERNDEKSKYIAGIKPKCPSPETNSASDLNDCIDHEESASGKPMDSTTLHHFYEQGDLTSMKLKESLDVEQCVERESAHQVQDGSDRSSVNLCSSQVIVKNVVDNDFESNHLEDCHETLSNGGSSSDICVRHHTKQDKSSASCSATVAATGCGTSSDHAAATITVHKNRTQFEQQDLLVPWHLRKKNKKETSLSEQERVTNENRDKVFYRYYHVFVEGEVEELCQRISGLTVMDSFYDQGNWCVRLQKC